MARILVVEDEPRIASFLVRGLGSTGYVTEVAPDGESARAMLERSTFDLVVLDMGLPGMDGLEVLRGLRARGLTMPVIVLTGIAERDVVTCLESGADDYMRKPFEFGELVARIRTRLRTWADRPDPLVLEGGGVTLDVRNRTATVGERVVDLTHREFMLLEALVRHPHQILTREQLLSLVWGFSFDPTTNLVNTYVYALRQKLGESVIQTVRGAGYRLGRAGSSRPGAPGRRAGSAGSPSEPPHGRQAI